jgi:hypothetical protein
MPFMTHIDEKGGNAMLAQAIGVYREMLRETTVWTDAAGRRPRRRRSKEASPVVAIDH